MGVVEKAVWLIETRLSDALPAAEIAMAAGVSTFHLSRVFRDATGLPPAAYARARHLTQAAMWLTGGDEDILGVALASGYGSHEAFTRAFREHFGVTPAAVRTQGRFDSLRITEAFVMTTSQQADLQQPRFEERPAFHVAGFAERCTSATNGRIPALWSRFAPHIGSIPGQVDDIAYGVCYNSAEDGSFDYLAGVEVHWPDEVARDFVKLTVPAQRYAIFAHTGHVSDIRQTYVLIWNLWLPSAQVERVDGPDFERYDDRFDAETGTGVVEIWVPVRVSTR